MSIKTHVVIKIDVAKVLYALAAIVVLITTFDYDKLRLDVQASVDRLRADNAATRQQMDAMAKFVSQHCVGLAGDLPAQIWRRL